MKQRKSTIYEDSLDGLDDDQFSKTKTKTDMLAIQGASLGVKGEFFDDPKMLI